MGCRLSAQVRSGDGSIINTVRVKPMTCLSCYSQLSDLSRKDIKRKCGWKAKHCGWEQGGGGPCEELTLLSPGFCIALSFLIRKLMQLSVLILESSFYSFLLLLLLCNLFLFRSALICAVAADDKTAYIRLLSSTWFAWAAAIFTCFNNFAVESGGKNNFSR